MNWYFSVVIMLLASAAGAIATTKPERSRQKAWWVFAAMWWSLLSVISFIDLEYSQSAHLLDKSNQQQTTIIHNQETIYDKLDQSSK